MGVSTWKLKEINMDFFVVLPPTCRQNYSITVLVDRLTKSTHIIPINSTYTADDYSRIYTDEIMSLNGILLSIISYRLLNSLLVFGSLLKKNWIIK